MNSQIELIDPKIDNSITNIEYSLQQIQLIIQRRKKISINNIFMELENSTIDVNDNNNILDKSSQENDIKYTLSNVEYNINDLKKFIENEKLTTSTFQENLETLTEYFSDIIKKYTLEIDTLKNRVNYLESITNTINVTTKKDFELSNKEPEDDLVIYNTNKRDYNRNCGGCLF